SVAFSVSLSPGTLRPGGKARAAIASAPSAPLVRITLTGTVAPKPCATSIGAEGASSVTGVGRAGAATRPYCVITLVGRFVCWAKTIALIAVRSIGPLGPSPRATSLRGAAGNLALASAASDKTPVVWPAAIVPGRTDRPPGGSATVTVIGPA